MVTRRPRTLTLRRAGALAALSIGALLALPPGPAAAADLPDDSFLRGTLDVFTKPAARWDGIYFGAHYGYSNLSPDFSDADSTLSVTFANQTTNSQGYGGFLGYNVQIDQNLVIGLDIGYTRPTSLETTSTASGGGLTASSTYRLADWGTARLRAGYAFGQFMPYAVLGGAIGRIDYSTVAVDGAGATVYSDSRDNAYTAGLVAGLGIDVLLLPNVFLRGEWEYVAFSSVGGIRSQVSTGRVGIGVRF
jgi:opacity protein-like surface antigen